MNRFVAILCILSLSGCVTNTSIVSVDKSALSMAHVRSAYVPRFEGSPDYVDESSDYFIATLQGRVPFPITPGGPLRAEGVDVGHGGNLAPDSLATSAAKQSGSDVVIVGKVTSYSKGGTLNGFSTVHVIRVSDGRVLATFHRPSGLMLGSEHSAVMAAVKRTSDDVADALTVTP